MILGMDEEKQQIYPSEKKIMGIDEKKQQIYPSEKKIMGMDEEKQQIYPSEKKLRVWISFLSSTTYLMVNFVIKL